MRAYAGIGSRNTPPDVCELMVELARLLAARHQLELRSGAAPRADTAFSNGAMLWEPRLVKLYLPWPGYNGVQVAQLERPAPAAYELAKRFHPFWDNLRDGARHLHARNSHIILGDDLRSPVEFVVCWTTDGSLDGTGSHCGGTGQALRVAAAYEIPVFNLAREQHRFWAQDFVGPMLATT